MGNKALKKRLTEVAEKARSISELDDVSQEQADELKGLLEEGERLRGKIRANRTIDEFLETVSDKEPVGKSEPTETYLGPVSAGSRFHAVADRKGFEDAVEKWRTKQLDSHWGFDVRYKTDLSDSTSETGAGAEVLHGVDPGHQYGGAVAPFYYPGIVEPPTRPPLIADLFSQGQTDSNLVRLVKETFTSNGAASTAEGTAYGAVKLEVSPVDWPVRDITALLPVTEDILMDIPAMSSYLSMRLSKFVQLAEEDELVTGDATGNHLEGLLHLVGVTTRNQGGDDFDSAVMKLTADVYAASFMDPEWVVMSPTAWAHYITQRTNLNGGFGQFLAGPPSLAAVRQIWGLPIVVTPAVPDNKVIVGNSAAGMIFRHGGLRVESSTGYGTFFGEGLVAIRGKIRTAFALFRPQAIGILTLSS